MVRRGRQPQEPPVPQQPKNPLQPPDPLPGQPESPPSQASSPMQQSKRWGWWTRKRRWQKIALVVVAVPVALFLALVIATIVDPPDHTARDATATAAKSTTVANGIVSATAKQQSQDAMTTATTVSASATQGTRSTSTAGAQVAAQAATQSAQDAKGTATAALTEMPTPVTATGSAITVASTNATATPLAPTSTPTPPTEMPTSAPAETAVAKETATAAVTSTTTPLPPATPAPTLAVAVPTATAVPATAIPAPTDEQMLNWKFDTWGTLNSDGKYAVAQALVRYAAENFSPCALTPEQVIALMDKQKANHWTPTTRADSIELQFGVATVNYPELQGTNCPGNMPEETAVPTVPVATHVAGAPTGKDYRLGDAKFRNTIAQVLAARTGNGAGCTFSQANVRKTLDSLFLISSADGIYREDPVDIGTDWAILSGAVGCTYKP